MYKKYIYIYSKYSIINSGTSGSCQSALDTGDLGLSSNNIMCQEVENDTQKDCFSLGSKTEAFKLAQLQTGKDIGHI